MADLLAGLVEVASQATIRGDVRDRVRVTEGRGGSGIDPDRLVGKSLGQEVAEAAVVSGAEGEI